MPSKVNEVSAVFPVVVVSGSPAQCAELSLTDESSYQLRQAATDAIKSAVDCHNPARILVLCSKAPDNFTSHSGSFAAWGAPHATVSSGNYLGEIVVRYLLERRLGIDEIPVEALDFSQSLGDAVTDDDLLLIVADGSAGLSEKAPLSLLPHASSRHNWCTELLANTPPNRTPCEENLAEWLKSGGVIDPAPWVALTELKPAETKLVFSTASGGLGRYVASWKEVSL